jgi:transposase InsO family protein
MKAYAMNVHKGRTSRTRFRRGTARQKESQNSSIQMCVAQCHHPPLVGMYTISFIDNYSRKDLDIFEVFSKFKEFKALIENLCVRKIKILRSDNGGEYTSKEFMNFCKYFGIKIPNKMV